VPHRLLLIRHAQAGHAPLDRDRPLTEQGARDAAAIGRWLAEAGLVPDRVVVSPALRAAQTWSQAAAALPDDRPTVVERRIYDNTLDDLVDVIEETPAGVETLALVGHNPAVEALAHALDDGQGDAAARGSLARGFPAGAVAVFDLGIPFGAVEDGTATLRTFRVPPHQH
jgi:phosphohistidine phosphatase